MSQKPSRKPAGPSQQISSQIGELRDWRGPVYARLRKLILEAVPGISEEWKWGTAVWAHQGLVCSVGVFQDHVKLNFFRGAELKDPKRLFNAGLEARTTRAIDFYQDDRIDPAAVKALVRSAVALNIAGPKKK
jgi:hypothetical protein